MFPFKGASYAIVSVYERVSGSTVNYGSYIVYNVVMSIILLSCFILFIRFVLHPDVEGFKNITVAELTKENLPKMNAQQMAFFMMILVYVSTLLAPNFLPKSIPFIGFLADIGLLGITIFCMTALMIIPFKGAPMMDFKNIAKKSFNWDIFFLVAAVMYSCNVMTDEFIGIKPFLIELLQPLLGG